MKRLLLLPVIAILFSLQSFGQNNLDSLWGVWKNTTQPDTTRLKAIHRFAVSGYLFSQPDSAFHYLQKEYDFAKKEGLKKHMAQALFIQGVSYYLRGSYPEALDLYQQSLEMNQKLGDKRGVARSLNNMGVIYDVQGNYPQALNYYQRSLTIKEKLGDDKGVAQSLNNMGIIHKFQGNYSQALEYAQRSLAIRKETNDKKGISQSFNNIGSIYREQGSYATSLEYYKGSLAIKEELNDTKGIAESLINIGLIHKYQGNYSKALEYAQRSLTIKEELTDRKGIAGALITIGQIYQLQERRQLALDHCKKGLELSETIDALLLEREACNCLYTTYKGLGDSGSALEYHERMVALKDTIFNEENTKKLTRLEMQYEFDKKEAVMNERSEKQKIGLIASGMGLLLLLALAFSVYSGKKKSDELLLNILPEETAKELKAKGHADAKLIDEVTVLFTDFKGFTALSEQLSPEELVQDLNECFSAFDRICEKYGIEKIKTIGDAYMAASGLPVPDADHASKVVQAAFEMRNFIEEGKQRKIIAGLPYFEIRIGVHTGPVVAGIVGVKKFQYDIWGDTVNIASRMESSGEPGKVNISDATYKLVKDQFECTSRGEIEVKGKGLMKMWFVEE
jgi:class 3 adenylate cyclase/Tfp pilus assembly protein PilF